MPASCSLGRASKWWLIPSVRICCISRVRLSIPRWVASARRVLREKFMAADVGISGANFLVADTGATCTVTNEGNAELSTTPPRIHIVTAGIEKIVPSTDHAMALLRVLVRSATGGEVTQYTTFHCGP